MKSPFDLDDMLNRIAKATTGYPKAAMFELYERGYISLFEQLMACLISIRTRDETSIPVAEKLFAKARTSGELLCLSPEELAVILRGSQYPLQKAYTMLGIAKTAEELHSGNLPADFETLIALKGIGPKCANLALGIAAKKAAISVDVHVHRVVNRWGYIATTTPENTLFALEQKVPENKWIDINRLLMPFGKHICTARLPQCTTCPVLDYCMQVGVGKHA